MKVNQELGDLTPKQIIEHLGDINQLKELIKSMNSEQRNAFDSEIQNKFNLNLMSLENKINEIII